MKKSNGKLFLTLTLLMISLVIFPAFQAFASSPLPGAIWTTDKVGEVVNGNVIYETREDVYLNGGPNKKDNSKLAEGRYYIQITEPDGDVLGSSVGQKYETYFVNANGRFVDDPENPGNTAIVEDNLINLFLATQFNPTTNPGGEYKVWVSTYKNFDPNLSKTDNFKIKRFDEAPPSLTIIKFYDYPQLDGEKQPNEPELTAENDQGWAVKVTKLKDEVTPEDIIVGIFLTRKHLLLNPGTYLVEEYPLEAWVATTPTSYRLTLKEGDSEIVSFGNVHLTNGGGHTLGFWSNKNGMNLIKQGSYLPILPSNLVNATGSNSSFSNDETTKFRTWLLSANADNMSYMLSAQLATMKLNTLAGANLGFVDSNSQIFLGFSYDVTVNGVVVSNKGFIKISDLIAATNEALGNAPKCFSDNPSRGYLEFLKNGLDKANNDETIYVNPTPPPGLYFNLAELF